MGWLVFLALVFFAAGTVWSYKDHNPRGDPNAKAPPDVCGNRRGALCTVVRSVQSRRTRDASRCLTRVKDAFTLRALASGRPPHSVEAPPPVAAIVAAVEPTAGAAVVAAGETTAAPPPPIGPA